MFACPCAFRGESTSGVPGGRTEKIYGFTNATQQLGHSRKGDYRVPSSSGGASHSIDDGLHGLPLRSRKIPSSEEE